MKALITGVSGQDGAYLSKFLLDKGYEIHGLQRRSASNENYRFCSEKRREFGFNRHFLS